MARFLLTTFLVTAVNCVIIGQMSQHYVQADFTSFGANLQVLEDGQIRMIGIGQNQYLFGRAGVYETTFSINGEAQGPRKMEGIRGEFAYGATIMPLADGSVVVLGEMSGCDYGIPPQLAYYDTFGALRWHVEIEYELYGPHILSLVKDSVIAISNDNQQGYYDLAGNALGALGEPPYDLQLSLTGGFLVSQQNTFQHLDAEFNVRNSVSFASPVISYDTAGGSGYIVLTDSLIVLDEDFLVVRATEAPGFFQHVISASNGYWLFNSKGEILHLDTKTIT